MALNLRLPDGRTVELIAPTPELTGIPADLIELAYACLPHLRLARITDESTGQTYLGDVDVSDAVAVEGTP